MNGLNSVPIKATIIVSFYWCRVIHCAAMCLTGLSVGNLQLYFVITIRAPTCIFNISLAGHLGLLAGLSHSPG